MKNNAKILFRGIRTWEKDGKEERALHKLNLWGPMLLGPMKWPLPTYYLEGDPTYTSVSSTLIRDRCKKIMSDNNKIKNRSGTSDGDCDENEKLDLSGLVPKEVEKDIVMAYSYS